MEFRILGPLEVLDAGREVALGGSKQRPLLALLVLHANETLSTDRLIDELWGDRPPAKAAKTVQVHISRLRKALASGAGNVAHGDGPVVTREHGYELRVEPERIDARRFERLVEEGRRELAAGRPERAAAALEGALSLWRGAPLGDVAYEPFAQREIARLEELRVAAVEQLIEARLELGRNEEVVPQLEALIHEHPYRERLRAQLMLALHRCDRQADALQAYQDARRTLVEQLGIEPGERLRELERAILRQDGALAAPPPAAGTASARRAPPADGSPLPERLVEEGRPATGSLEGERKQVTVLFSDIEGSMALAEGTDPELWRELLDRFLAIVSEAVHRYEGTVNRFTGDGAMALFGAPIAHEDHARRACYASLRLRDALADFGRELQRDYGLDFSVRIGLNSGEVVAGAVGEDRQAGYTAIGHTVGLAARMQEAAEPGTPYLTGRTAALVEGYFELEDLGEMEVKGARKPVRTFGLTSATAVRTRLDVAARGGLLPLVGREPELAALEAALSRAGGSGQVVGVVAEPGVGKSRLCREFGERCRGRGMRVTVGGGLAHGQRVPLLPVLELLRTYFGIDEQNDPPAARAKIAAALTNEDLRELLPVLFDFLGVPDPERPAPAQMAPEARQRALFAAMRRLVETAADDVPGLLVIEDLHWLDPSSEALLAHLVDSLPGARALLVITFRPEYQAHWMRRSYYQQLPLAPLERDQTAELVEALTGPGPSLDGLSRLIAERTGGNPFFIEEVVQGLAEDGTLEGNRGDYRLARPIDEIEIPASVQALLAARIDRLPEREKAVLQGAAVIGREFSHPVLSRVAGLPEHELVDALAVLADAELTYERTPYPEARYAFKHPLTQEVAYRSQLRERRARTHAAAASALEALHSDRREELSALISGHWEQAQEPLPAARWGARAAAWAGRSHPADALRHWRRVRTLSRDRPDSPEAANLGLAACVWILQLSALVALADDEVDETYREAQALAGATGDKAAIAMVRSAYSVARGMYGRLQEAIAISREAQELAEQAGDLELQLSPAGPGHLLAVAGRNREALAEFDRILLAVGDDYQLGRRSTGLSAAVFAAFHRGVVLTELGRLREARAAGEEGVRLAGKHEELEVLGWAHGVLGGLSFFTGESDDGLAHARTALQLAETVGSTLSRALALWTVALAHLARREHDKALVVAGDALQIMRESHTGLQYRATLLHQLAEARLGLGDAEGARAAAAEGTATAASQGARVQQAACRLTLGRALLLQNRDDDSRFELQRALGLAGEDGPVYIPHVLLALADLAGNQGKHEERVRHLEHAHDLFERQGATGHARRVAAQLATAPP